MRVSPSFLRFGNFEILAAREEHENLKNLVNWTTDKYYPHIQGEDKVIMWFREVVERTASLMVEWLRVGFVHGVMNTDNMSVLGLTIDYGPFSFLDDYDLRFTPNTTDLPGRRYAFGKQANIAQWNLGCLGGAIALLFPDTKQLIHELESYEDIFYRKYYNMMGNKLGLDQVNKEDISFIVAFEKMLSQIQPDMTIFYQLLIDLALDVESEDAMVDHFMDSFYGTLSLDKKEAFVNILKSYIARIKINNCSREDSREIMRKANPRIILRNYLLQQAIEGLEKGNDELFIKLQKAMKEPYSKNHDELFVKRPEWAMKKAGCSMLSCSS
jgi:serine/tyrosine/threonine adenylyltransferase